jgi:hypothetical protein
MTTARQKLCNLEDALVESILGMTDEEIRDEYSEAELIAAANAFEDALKRAKLMVGKK